MITILTKEHCLHCTGLKAYIKGRFSENELQKIRFVDLEEFGEENAKELGILSLPTVLTEDGSIIRFTNLLETVEKIRTVLKK